MNDPAPAPKSDIDPSLLEQIVDESVERSDCRAWLYQEMAGGGDPDQLLAQLIENGWDPEEAEEMVEEQRQATRHLRGAITRQQVARAAEARYRASMSLPTRGIGYGWIVAVAQTFLAMVQHPWPKSRRDRRAETDRDDVSDSK